MIGLRVSRHTSIYSRHLFWKWGFPRQKTHNPPPETAAKLCGLNLFFGRDSELQIYHGNLLLMDNKHRKLFVIKQSKGCNFMPQIYQNTFTGRTRSPAGGTSAGFWLGAKKILKISLRNGAF